ncbi:STM3941 family protein [Brevundimonas sp. GCM10030266]|uniref:STM3941 family protein n=1 Tax=Brevundimonas sp. GCM10030266 TaxID=3273386 RepID=UPI003609849C
MTAPDTFILRQDPAKLFRLFVVSLVFALIGAWMFLHPEGSRRHSAEFNGMIGLLTMVGFGLGAAFSFWAMLNPVQLVLSSEGFEVKGWWSRALIPWSEVEEFSVVKVWSSTMVSCMLTTAGEERARRGGSWPSLVSETNIVPPYLEQRPDYVSRILEDWRRAHS